MLKIGTKYHLSKCRTEQMLPPLGYIFCHPARHHVLISLLFLVKEYKEKYSQNNIT